MSTEELKLSLRTDQDGKIFLVDQDGRVLRGVVELDVSAPIDDACTALIRVCMYDSSGKKFVNRI